MSGTVCRQHDFHRTQNTYFRTPLIRLTSWSTLGLARSRFIPVMIETIIAPHRNNPIVRQTGIAFQNLSHKPNGFHIFIDVIVHHENKDHPHRAVRRGRMKTVPSKGYISVDDPSRRLAIRRDQSLAEDDQLSEFVFLPPFIAISLIIVIRDPRCVFTQTNEEMTIG